MIELEKYKLIYSSLEYSYYGHTNHGKGSYDLVTCLSPLSIVDIGCGHNEFCSHFKSLGVQSIGVDFACPSADVISTTINLPFQDNEFDILTSFDTLEHLLPSEIDVSMEEFQRVSKRFVFSISYVPSKILVKGENLHPSVFPEEWWISKIKELASVFKHDKYIFGYWK